VFKVLSLVSSILTLTLIACDRFFGIVFAMKARVTERRSPLLIAAVWVSAICLSSPLLVYRQQSVRRWSDHTEIWCDDTWPPVSRTTRSDHVRRKDDDRGNNEGVGR
jgi:7 transmembrane receptor (rhodopsin family)